MKRFLVLFVACLAVQLLARKAGYGTMGQLFFGFLTVMALDFINGTGE